MLSKNEQPAAVRNFCKAIGNLASELIDAGGVSHDAIAAGLRIEAARIARSIDREDMAYDERELLGLVSQAHGFINTLQVAGIDEHIAIVAIGNALVERVTRERGAAGAAHWLRGLAQIVDENGDALEATAQAH